MDKNMADIFTILGGNEGNEEDCQEDGNEERRREFVGPPRLAHSHVSFWPASGRTASVNAYQHGMTQQRANVLFGLSAAADGFDGLFGKHSILGIPVNRPQHFQLVPSDFIRRAEERRPKNPQPTATAFAAWLYSLYASAHGDEIDQDRGKALEPAILERRKEIQGAVHNGFLRRIGSDWRLAHCGLHLPGQDNVPWFSIDALRVNGEALKASPDLMYHNARLNEVLIVEIKHSFMEIPSNLWPNVWGQLWCYSHLELARSASHITVIGEVWGERTTWRGRGKERESYEELHLRASVRRNPRRPAYDRFFRTLFEIYRGRCVVM